MHGRGLGRHLVNLHTLFVEKNTTSFKLVKESRS